MREGAIPEVILSLVTTPERAASVVGDLLEERESPAAFWLAIARMLVTGLVREIGAHPFLTLSVAFSGWLAQLIDSYLVMALVMVSTGVASGSLEAPGAAVLWGARISAPIAYTLVPLLIGWRTGKDSGGRELAMALATAAVLPFGVPKLLEASKATEFLVIVPFTLASAILYRFSVKKPSRRTA